MTQPDTAATESRFIGDRRVVASGVVSVTGLALIAMFFASPAVAFVVVGSWFLGLIVGLHVQAIREARWRQENDHGN